jgi:hypothetical protein
MARGITGGVAPPLEEIDKLLEDGGDVAYELRDAKGEHFLVSCICVTYRSFASAFLSNLHR